jgi:hypothetical protein
MRDQELPGGQQRSYEQDKKELGFEEPCMACNSKMEPLSAPFQLSTVVAQLSWPKTAVWKAES